MFIYLITYLLTNISRYVTVLILLFDKPTIPCIRTTVFTVMSPSVSHFDSAYSNIGYTVRKGTQGLSG